MSNVPNPTLSDGEYLTEDYWNSAVRAGRGEATDVAAMSNTYGAVDYADRRGIYSASLASANNAEYHFVKRDGSSIALGGSIPIVSYAPTTRTLNAAATTSTVTTVNNIASIVTIPSREDCGGCNFVYIKGVLTLTVSAASPFSYDGRIVVTDTGTGTSQERAKVMITGVWNTEAQSDDGFGLTIYNALPTLNVLGGVYCDVPFEFKAYYMTISGATRSFNIHHGYRTLSTSIAPSWTTTYSVYPASITEHDLRMYR